VTREGPGTDVPATIDNRTIDSTGTRRDRYKWTVLFNATLGVLMVTINQSILLISLPDIFRGIGLQPLAPGNTSYFLWILMGYLLVTAVLVVSLGRVGDMYGRVRIYNLGFAIFTFFSILLSVTWLHGAAGALWIISMRVFQGVGGACVIANSSALITDAFPEAERGRAMGIYGISTVVGAFCWARSNGTSSSWSPSRSGCWGRCGRT
jgi:MFS family permease